MQMKEEYWQVKTVSPVRFEGVIPREMRIFVVLSAGNSVNL